jgi:hypothetical protein
MFIRPDERRVIHLPVKSNIPPTTIIDYYTIFLCTIINKNIQLLKLNILLLLYTNMIV